MHVNSCGPIVDTSNFKNQNVNKNDFLAATSVNVGLFRIELSPNLHEILKWASQEHRPVENCCVLFKK